MVGRRETAERRLSNAQGDWRERERWREPLAGDELETCSATAQCASLTPGPDRIHTKHSMGYSAFLDHSTETLTLLDQSPTDVCPVEDFNGALYPSFAQV